VSTAEEQTPAPPLPYQEPDDPWDEVTDEEKKVLTERVATMHPGTSASYFWRSMHPYHREQWIHDERQGTPITKTWHLENEEAEALRDFRLEEENVR
jgi:hypothetical protein